VCASGHQPLVRAPVLGLYLIGSYRQVLVLVLWVLDWQVWYKRKSNIV